MIFDPNSTGSLNSGLFGLPYTREESELIVLPVVWEATTSYGDGTSEGPRAILEASAQVDLYDIELGEFYERGLFMEPLENLEWMRSLNHDAKASAKEIREHLEAGEDLTSPLIEAKARVNTASHKVNDWVYNQATAALQSGKKVAVIGGDHSSPFGLIRAVSEKHKGKFGVLHVDAHADLRNAYQGFTYSHASIMYNVMTSSFKPEKLVQVGIRDFCREEKDLIDSRSDIRTFFDRDLKLELDEGTPWRAIAQEIIGELPQNIYISFDIDGLDPQFCPNTGTPVPGGLSFDQALSLLAEIRRQGKTIVGFDLNEVAPGPHGSQWDGNVGARLLFKLCGYYLLTEDN